MASLDDPDVRKLLEQPNYATVSTLNDDGTILNAVVWIGYEDGKVLLNSAKGRKWPRNLQRDPRLTVSVPNSDNPYEYLEIRGTATSTTDGAADLIERLSHKYTGGPYGGWTPGQERITYVVQPDYVRHRTRD